MLLAPVSKYGENGLLIYSDGFLLYIYRYKKRAQWPSGVASRGPLSPLYLSSKISRVRIERITWAANNLSLTIDSIHTAQDT